MLVNFEHGVRWKGMFTEVKYLTSSSTGIYNLLLLRRLLCETRILSLIPDRNGIALAQPVCLHALNMLDPSTLTIIQSIFSSSIAASARRIKSDE